MVGKKKGPISQVERVSASLSGLKISDDKQVVSKFPLKPLKDPNVRAPGNQVELVTNLMNISIKQNKTIYKYDVEVNPHEEKVSNGDSSKSKFIRKLNNELRTEIVRKAVNLFVKNNLQHQSSKSGDFKFAYDPNGKMLYTLFDMFEVNKQEQNSATIYEKIIDHEDEKIMDGAFVKVTKQYNIKIKKIGTAMNFFELTKNCKLRNQSYDNAKYIEVIRAIDFLLHADIMQIHNYIVTKFSVFNYTEQKQFLLSQDVLINQGFSMSARPAECGLLLNVANTSKAFYKASCLLSILQNHYGIRDLNKPLTNDVNIRLKKEFYNKQVEATHRNMTPNLPKAHYQKYRITGISSIPCSKEKFKMIDKKTNKEQEVTVIDYFRDEYGYKIKYPNLPCIESNKRKLPIEVCTLVEKQGVARRMTPNETSKIIQKMAVSPLEYFKSVEDNIREIKKPLLSKTLTDFGLEVNPQLIKVIGREITPLPLAGKNRTINPRDGQYETRNVAFYRSVVINNWVIAFLGDRKVKNAGEAALNVMAFANNYRKEAVARGMTLANKPDKQLIDIEKDEREIIQILKKKFSEWNLNKIDHAIIVVPGNCPDWIYPFIKYLEVSYTWQDKQFSTKTSCIEYNNYIRKIIEDRFGGTMFISNILLKHNTKLGGLNFILYDNKGQFNKFLQDGFIFLSVDVCHPSPCDRLEQSVAAVVGMWNLTSKNLSFCTRIRVQKKENENRSTIEEVGEIGIMMHEIFEEYKRKENKLPTKIVILRDGVSDGQYRMVLERELVKVENAISKLYTATKQPLAPMTCVVVQKRNKVRFKRVKAFVNSRGIEDYNIQPGTVVDCTITHPTDFEFYFSAHKAIKGTSRPPRYYVVCDKVKFNQYEFEAMVNGLSYLSPRCTKSTSIPTPVNLADLAAERGKNIVVSYCNDNKFTIKHDDDLKKINSFLSNFGDRNYKNTLYYI